MQNLGQTTSFRPIPQTIVLMGDSITALNSGPHGIDQAGTLSARGFWTWANFYLDQRFWVVAQKGVGGNTTAQMLARFYADVLEYSSGWVCIEGGSNDIAQGMSSATIISNLSQMINLSLNAHRRVILLTASPSSSYDSDAKRTVLADVNSWVLAQDSLQVVTINVWSLYQDVANNGFPITGYVVDTVHPSAFGAEIIGRAIATKLLTLTASRALSDVLNNDLSPTAIVHDGFASTVGYSLVGGVTLGVSGGKLTVSLVSYTGEEALATKLTSISSGTFAIGDILQASVHIKWSNVAAHDIATMSHYPLFRFMLRNVDSSWQTIQSFGMTLESVNRRQISTALLPASGEGLLLTQRFTIGANGNRIYISLGWIGADSGSFEFSDLQCWKV